MGFRIGVLFAPMGTASNPHISVLIGRKENYNRTLEASFGHLPVSPHGAFFLSSTRLMGIRVFSFF